jgi:hypothetical protein
LTQVTQQPDRALHGLDGALQHVIELIFRDPEVGRAPDWAPVAKENHLRRLMANTEARRRLIGNIAMALHCDDLVRHTAVGGVNVRAQLIQRFAADPARAAVLEQKDGPLTRLGNRRFELVDM